MDIHEHDIRPQLLCRGNCRRAIVHDPDEIDARIAAQDRTDGLRGDRGILREDHSFRDPGGAHDNNSAIVLMSSCWSNPLFNR